MYCQENIGKIEVVNIPQCIPPSNALLYGEFRPTELATTAATFTLISQLLSQEKEAAAAVNKLSQVMATNFYLQVGVTLGLVLLFCLYYDMKTVAHNL